MTGGPRDYDREYVKARSHTVRVRMGYSSNGSEITRFVLQLEYRRDDEWREVVRFDHDPEGEEGHDVTSDGVHMDIYRDGEKFRSAEIFPPMPVSDALTFAEDHLAKHAERYVTRFEKWHGIRSR